jgi:O-succinylbenzoate synthase
LRKGWGPFGPLPLGGSREDLDQAAERIVAILVPDGEE